MLFNEPPPSQADLHFRLFGFPVRIHPFFWVVAVVLGLRPGSDGGTSPEELLSWVAVVFISILVHECGHAFLQRRFGGRPWIVLHSFGGLACCNDCDRSPRSQILISLAGPAAGFCLAAAVAIVLMIAGYHVGLTLGAAAEHVAPPYLSIGIGRISWESPTTEFAAILVWYLFYVNIFWGLVNLLPIYPLDGGQIAREVCTLKNPSSGIEWSLQISMICAGAMAVVGAFAWQSLFIALMFGILSYSSYQTLQAYRASRW